MNEPSQHTHNSTHREKILEHYFIGELLRHVWKAHRDEKPPEVTYSDVDNAGYDIIIEWRAITRHIQLKSTVNPKSDIRVNSSLGDKPSGCVVLMTCSDDLTSVDLSWLGGTPQNRLPMNYPPAKHTRANSEGVKKESISAVKVKRTEFDKIQSFGQLVNLLFPPEIAHS